ncbi:MAG: class I SAM-dependent methyltransferase [Bacteroidales bacterium]|jgi:ubiquinone/menaquinone biosynthesis C-methylase UbiE
MNTENMHRVCPVELAGGLDNIIRKFLQNPKKLLEPYIKPGMTFVDLGCGPGFFTVEVAKMLKGQGKVIAVDLQDRMLDIVRKKITDTPLEQLVVLNKCSEDSINVKEPVDFILAFYMIHEVPDKERLFREMSAILKSAGLIYVIEPKFFVSKREFAKMVNIAQDHGFEPAAQPRVHFGTTVLLRRV